MQGCEGAVQGEVNERSERATVRRDVGEAMFFGAGHCYWWALLLVGSAAGGRCCWRALLLVCAAAGVRCCWWALPLVGAAAWWALLLVGAAAGGRCCW